MAFGEDVKCVHVKLNGMQCKSPAMKGERYCYFHREAQEQNRRITAKQAGAGAYRVPVLEDVNAVQLGLMQVMEMLALGKLDHRTAGLMLYALQTASANLRRIDPDGDPERMKAAKDQEVLRALITLGKHLDDPVSPEVAEKLFGKKRVRGETGA